MGGKVAEAHGKYHFFVWLVLDGIVILMHMQ